MEVLDYKLNSNNPVLITQVFSSLIGQITQNKNNKQELTYLKNKCLGLDPLVTEVARASMVKLVENGTLEVDHILADFVTSISTTKNVTPLTKIIANLLYLQLESRSKENSDHKIKLLQHPFIKILHENYRCETQICTYNEIVQSYSKDPRLAASLTTLYNPVYLYCICSPIFKLELYLIKHKLWTFLVNYSNEINNSDIILELCCWLQVENESNTHATSILIEEALYTKNAMPDDILILLQIFVLYNMIINKTDCDLILRQMQEVVKRTDFFYTDCSLLILSRAILVTSPLYLEELLKLCHILLKTKSSSSYGYLAIKSSCLLWIASPSLLTNEALRVAEKILNKENKQNNECLFISNSNDIDSNMHNLVLCNPELFLYVALSSKMNEMKNNEYTDWLEELEKAPLFYIKHIFSPLCGILLHKNMKRTNLLKILSLITKCSSYYTELLPTVLTLILYQLSNTQESQFYFALLKALPLMARVKENVSKVVATIKAISKESNDLENFALTLMYNTWDIDNICYSSLECLLLSNKQLLGKDMFEYNVSKAYVLKNLCKKRPELYGRDLVVHLSKILNECVTPMGSLPSAFAIDGITHLCKAEIIDIVTIWDTLAPKFKADKRIPVIKSFCLLISQIPQLQYAQGYDKLNTEVIQYLWNYVISNENEEVISAALDTLSSFNLELVCLEMPGVFLEENNTQQSIGDQRIVPGKTWLSFLSKCKSRKAARNFLVKLVSIEVASYLKYVYQIKGQKEPINFGGLPSHSIVRTLGEFIKNNVKHVNEWENTVKEKMYIECLHILSQKYSKPLPPLDWCFLQELVFEPKMKKYCLDLASHQAVLSGSARRLVENYIVVLTEKPQDNDLINFYSNLKYLANSIQPMILKPFFKSSLEFAINNLEVNPTTLEVFLKCLKHILQDSDVQHINKNVIEDVLKGIILVTDSSSKTFTLLLECIHFFSKKGQEELGRFNIAPKFEWEEFRKKMLIRCYIASCSTLTSPLAWLNETFEVASKANIGIETCYNDISEVFKMQVDQADSPMWLLEFFGQIQAKVADRCDMKEISYFCDILVIAVIHFSGFYAILPKPDYANRKYFFPSALALLLREHNWSICTAQVLEWLYHMNSAENMPKEYQHIFGLSLCCLRHRDEFSKNSKWMKYFDCELSANK